MTDNTPIDPLPGEGPPQAVPPAAGAPAPPTPTAGEPGPVGQDERTWGMLAHLSSLLVFTAIPFAHILGPLVVWLVKREQMPFVDDQGKESLNFQISMTIYGIVATILVFVLVGFVLWLVLGIAWIVLVIVAAMRANGGERYRYPVTIRFLK